MVFMDEDLIKKLSDILAEKNIDFNDIINNFNSSNSTQSEDENSESGEGSESSEGSEEDAPVKKSLQENKLLNSRRSL